MHKNINKQDMIENTHGAIIVEFTIVILLITIFIKAMISVSEYYSTVGKLDRTSYSLAGIIRERTKLYSNDNELTVRQTNQLWQLAENMLSNSGISNPNMALTIETLHFNPTKSSAIEDKVIDDTKSLPLSIGDCEPVIPLRELTHLSTFSNAGRWIPLYQVTLCLPAPVWLQTPGENETMIKSSAIAIER